MENFSAIEVAMLSLMLIVVGKFFKDIWRMYVPKPKSARQVRKEEKARREKIEWDRVHRETLSHDKVRTTVVTPNGSKTRTWPKM